MDQYNRSPQSGAEHARAAIFHLRMTCAWLRGWLWATAARRRVVVGVLALAAASAVASWAADPWRVASLAAHLLLAWVGSRIVVALHKIADGAFPGTGRVSPGGAGQRRHEADQAGPTPTTSLTPAAPAGERQRQSAVIVDPDAVQACVEACETPELLAAWLIGHRAATYQTGDELRVLGGVREDLLDSLPVLRGAAGGAPEGLAAAVRAVAAEVDALTEGLSLFVNAALEVLAEGDGDEVSLDSKFHAVSGGAAAAMADWADAHPDALAGFALTRAVEAVEVAAVACRQDAGDRR